MEELFSLHFIEQNKRFTYRLSPEQAGSMYVSIGEYLTSIDSAAGFDVIFTEKSPTGRDRRQAYKLDTTDTFNLYRRLGTYLQKHCQDSEPPLRLHEAMP